MFQLQDFFLIKTNPRAKLLNEAKGETDHSASLGRGRESDLSVPVVEDRVVLAHEHVAEDPEGAHRLGHVHAHDGQDAHLAVPGVDHVLVSRQCVLLKTKGRVGNCSKK